MRFEDAENKVIAFRDDRDWLQFHNPKDLAISISLEAAELLEVFQWSGTDLSACDKKDRMVEELADVLIYCVLLADRLGVDVPQIISDKVDTNAEKYPVEKAKGNSQKYSAL
ncbi:MAG: nucleotide pyrophosphohydrolase [Eggerthellaceae bacterium]|nr:nucleotide pyrophosphohydrolase [Eggerthellaceae bacterium]